MGRLPSLFPAVALLVTGCAGHTPAFNDVPSLPRNYGVTAASVLFSIKCEIAEAVAGIQSDTSGAATSNINKEFIRNWAASITTTLELEQKRDGNLSASPLVALANGSRFTASPSVSANRRHLRRSTITTNLYFREFTPVTLSSCADAPRYPVADPSRETIYRINGVVGLGDWMDQVYGGLRQEGVNIKSLNYDTEFQITYKAGVGAVFTPAAAFADSVGAGIGANAESSTLHKVEMVTIDGGKPQGAKKPKSRASIDDELRRQQELQILRSRSDVIMLR